MKKPEFGNSTAFTVLCLAALLSLAGCKKNNPAAGIWIMDYYYPEDKIYKYTRKTVPDETYILTLSSDAFSMEVKHFEKQKECSIVISGTAEYGDGTVSFTGDRIAVSVNGRVLPVRTGGHALDGRYKILADEKKLSLEKDGLLLEMIRKGESIE